MAESKRLVPVLADTDKLMDEDLAKNVGESWSECALKPEELFQATDDLGRVGWWLRLSITGLYPRRFGPFKEKATALKVLDAFLAVGAGEALLEAANETHGESMARVVIEDTLHPQAGPKSRVGKKGR